MEKLPASVARWNAHGDSVARKNAFRATAVENWSPALRGPSAAEARWLIFLISFFFFKGENYARWSPKTSNGHFFSTGSIFLTNLKNRFENFLDSRKSKRVFFSLSQPDMWLTLPSSADRRKRVLANWRARRTTGWQRWYQRRGNGTSIFLLIYQREHQVLEFFPYTFPLRVLSSSLLQLLGCVVVCPCVCVVMSVF